MNGNDGRKYFFLEHIPFHLLMDRFPPNWCNFPLNVLFSNEHEFSPASPMKSGRRCAADITSLTEHTCNTHARSERCALEESLFLMAHVNSGSFDAVS